MSKNKKEANIDHLKKIVLVGNPNVGKSVLFNKLSNSYVVVSNYPGTTVKLDKAKVNINGDEYGLYDSPGMYSINSLTQEERVTRNILFEKPDLVLHVIDSKNLDRMLHLSIELIEASLPVIIVLNMADEARKKGIKIDEAKLEKLLGVPVVQTISITGQGIDKLKSTIQTYKKTIPKKFEYCPKIEKGISELSKNLKQEHSISKRTISLLLLANDQTIKEKIKVPEQTKSIRQEVQNNINNTIKCQIAYDRQKIIENIMPEVAKQPRRSELLFREKLSRAMMNPLTGIPLLLLVLYFGLYQFVGVFGAGTIVDFLEVNLFEQFINPFVNNLLTQYVPWIWLQNLLGMEYGIITLGIRYAFAIVFPIVATFFFAFSIIEDTGYLPRLAMLVDNLFKKIGLNGRAVIPMVLGLGCDTMATIVTRTQETNKERIITTLLLALAIPCSAQLGVIFGILSGNPTALLIWIAVVVLIFLFIGWLASKVIIGEQPYFYMELPPLRTPRISNVLTKVYSRMVWYFKEVLPIFVLASILIWAGKITGLFDVIINLLQPLVQVIGLPPQAAEAFLFGFFRRDYGAAGLYDIKEIMTSAQLVIASTVLTLFVPCIAQFSVMLKERGWKTTIMIVLFIIPFSFFVGYILKLILAGVLT
ncbi:MAG: Fe(2+) transporter FeoB [Candidatus Woesearchaeota archaeon]|nr:Fe(2+) transporter FeoB [Candidatus Woesearchaeota archaeon]